MVREWNPPAREPTSSGVARRSTIADVDAGQRQLAGQHQPGRTAPGNDHVNHRNHQLSKLSRAPLTGHVRASLRHDGGLAASPPARDTLEVAETNGARYGRPGRDSTGPARCSNLARAVGGLA